jgi:hypothetical protein
MLFCCTIALFADLFSSLCKVVVRSVMCQWCTRYRHQCSGDVGKVCGDVFGISRPVLRPMVSAAPLHFDSSSTNSQVVITVVEFKKKAVAKAEKDRKMKERAKETVKLKKASLPVAGRSTPLKPIICMSLLFSALYHLQLTWEMVSKVLTVLLRGAKRPLNTFWSSWRERCGK